MIDTLALLAVGAFGWGLSLVTYRYFAQAYGWPMGWVQWEASQIPVILGVAALSAGLLFAAFRGAADGGLVIILFGLLLALFWTGFLRVAAQTSLFLAPLAALFLLIGFFSGTPYDPSRLPRYGVDFEVPPGVATPTDRGWRRGD